MVLNKADIIKFNVHFKASMSDTFGSHGRMMCYSADIFIKMKNNHYEIRHSFYSKSVIKKIFGLAKYIPIFSLLFMGYREGYLSYDKYYNDIDKYEKYLKKNCFDNACCNYEEELQLCNEFIDKNPQNNYAKGQKATLYAMLNRNVDEIDNIFSELLKKYSRNTEFIRDYAHCYIYLKNYDRAKEILENITRI